LLRSRFYESLDPAERLGEGSPQCSGKGVARGAWVLLTLFFSKKLCGLCGGKNETRVSHSPQCSTRGFLGGPVEALFVSSAHSDADIDAIGISREPGERSGSSRTFQLIWCHSRPILFLGGEIYAR